MPMSAFFFKEDQKLGYIIYENKSIFSTQFKLHIERFAILSFPSIFRVKNNKGINLTSSLL